MAGYGFGEGQIKGCFACNWLNSGEGNDSETWDGGDRSIGEYPSGNRVQ